MASEALPLAFTRADLIRGDRPDAPKLERELPPYSHPEMLVVLYGAQQFLWLPKTKEGCPYGPGYFHGRRMEFTGALGRPSRTGPRVFARTDRCVGCGSPTTEDSAGDHIIPRSDGGSDSAENYLPMCRSCNSSKGRRDLLQWWDAKGRYPISLGLHLLVSYSRLKFQWIWTKGDPRAEAPGYLRRQVALLLEELPSYAHQRASMEVGHP